jgi:hypothetical protein
MAWFQAPERTRQAGLLGALTLDRRQSIADFTRVSMRMRPDPRFPEENEIWGRTDYLSGHIQTLIARPPFSPQCLGIVRARCINRAHEHRLV